MEAQAVKVPTSDPTLHPAATHTARTVDPDGTYPPLWEDTPKGALARKIVFLLQMYPYISLSMLQGSMNPSIKAAVWRPVYAELIEVGLIHEYSKDRVAPHGQHRSWKGVCLAVNIREIPEPNDIEPE